MNLVESKIHLINEKITSDFNRIEDLGVLKGLAGLALFNFNYSRVFNIDNKIGHAILEKCICKINDGYVKPTYCNGIIGLGWVINYLIKEEFIDPSNDELLLEIDTHTHYWLLASLQENNFDFLHGAIGYGNYFIDRYSNLKTYKNKETIEESISLLLRYLTNLLPNIQSFSYGSKEVTVKMSFENKVIFGLAHGISSIIFILNKFSTIKKFKIEALNLANQYVSYLLQYKNKQNIGISLFPNYLSSDGIVKYYSALSWCTGDLGIGYNLLNTSVHYSNNKTHRLEGIEILRHATQRKSLEKSLLKESNACHGYLGASKIFSNAYQMTKEENFHKIARYWLNLGLSNFTVENTDLSILNGLSGIGLILLDELNPKRFNWDECLFL